jgi:hypothetical protein
MELGKLKMLQVPEGLYGEGAMSPEFFQQVDSVLQEISQQNQDRLAGARRGVGLKGQVAPTGVGGEENTDTQHGVDTSIAPSSTLPTKVKVLCSMSYNASDRETTVTRAVDFVRRHNARDHKLKKERRVHPPAPIPAAVNKQMDEEVAQLLSLRGQRQWRLNLMAKLERTSRVNAARSQLPGEEREGQGCDPREAVDVRQLLGQ